ncbi:MAG: hypothetical protein DSY83_03680 [Flavobacteriia bacterium]|nr:MAG: hypothetical protein DSY83_03680 [Flavobacteriia bacterium]
MFSAGDILMARNRKRNAGFHFIIYIEPLDKECFVGSIITTSGKYPENIAMEDNFFEKVDENGKKYKIINKNSFLIPAKLIKLENWGPFSKKGRLSKEGCDFVDQHVGHLEPQIWGDLVKNYREMGTAEIDK